MVTLTSEVGAYSQASGLGTPQARLAMVTVGVLFVAYEVLRGVPSNHPWVWLSYAAGVVGSFLLSSKGTQPLPTGRASGLVVLSLAAAAALVAQPETNPRSWFFSYAAYLLALMVARGNLLSGGIGGALLLLMGSLWLFSQGSVYSGYVALLDIAVTALSAGLVWRWWFHRMVRLENEYRVSTEVSRQRARSSEASIASIRHSYSDVLHLAAPHLRALIAGEVITRTAQRKFSAIEAEIRDTLVAPGMQDVDLRDEVRRLRESGARVVLLGHQNIDGSSDPIPRRIVLQIIEEFQRTDKASLVTIRQHPPGTVNAWSLLIQDGRGRTRRNYSYQGLPLNTAGTNSLA